jgi:hypothetical protein
VCAVRPNENVYVEFSGSDPHNGQVEFSIRELPASWASTGSIDANSCSAETCGVWLPRQSFAKRE